MRLLGELSKVLTKRRPWTYNEETNAAQLLQQYGLDACLEVVKTMDAADSPVAMLRRRLEKPRQRASGREVAERHDGRRVPAMDAGRHDSDG